MAIDRHSCTEEVNKVLFNKAVEKWNGVDNCAAFLNRFTNNVNVAEWRFALGGFSHTCEVESAHKGKRLALGLKEVSSLNDLLTVSISNHFRHMGLRTLVQQELGMFDAKVNFLTHGTVQSAADFYTEKQATGVVKYVERKLLLNQCMHYIQNKYT